MDIGQLLLRKEELPIISKTHFIIPIHPVLLRDDVKLEPDLASSVFPSVAAEWYSEMQDHVRTMSDEKEKEWFLDVFLKDGPEVTKKENGRQVMSHGIWEDLVIHRDNGFAHVLSINRNAGGSLCLPGDGKLEYISDPFVNFSREKLDAYAVDKFEGTRGVLVHYYDCHNVDHYPGALFLRNWAIKYLNEAMRSVGNMLLK